MPADEFLDVLRVHPRSFGATPVFIAVDRDALEQQVGADRMPAFDAYVADQGGEVVPVTCRPSQSALRCSRRSDGASRALASLGRFPMLGVSPC